MTTETQNSTSPARPTHYAFQVRDRDNAKAIWTRIGSAWTHKDGNGFSITLDSLPLDGRISLRIATESK